MPTLDASDEPARIALIVLAHLARSSNLASTLREQCIAQVMESFMDLSARGVLRALVSHDKC